MENPNSLVNCGRETIQPIKPDILSCLLYFSIKHHTALELRAHLCGLLGLLTMYHMLEQLKEQSNSVGQTFERLSYIHLFPPDFNPHAKAKLARCPPASHLTDGHESGITLLI